MKEENVYASYHVVSFTYDGESGVYCFTLTNPGFNAN